MIYLADADIDRLILEDVGLGDLTTRALGLAGQRGEVRFQLRRGGLVSGVNVATRVMQRLGLSVEQVAADGSFLPDGGLLLHATGRADALHQAWKVSQNIVEWCSGVAQATAAMVAAARQVNPDAQVACTRKHAPGMRQLATLAVLDGGGIIHRTGTAETLLLFANHRRFFAAPFDWPTHIATIRRAAPEKLLVVEADTPEEAALAMLAEPDIVQLDKFTPDQVVDCLTQARNQRLRCRFSVCGGIGAHNAAQYAATGVSLLVSSAPYHALPADVQVMMSPI